MKRIRDPKQCLFLNGYAVRNTKPVNIEPSIPDSAPLDHEGYSVMPAMAAQQPTTIKLA